MKDKRGQMTILMVVMLVVVLLGSILLLVGGIAVTRFNTALDQDIDLGQVNLQQVNADTFGKVNEMVVNNADWWGICLIFGMIMGLFLSAYFTRGRFPKWGIVLDIFIIVCIFLASLYISSSYSTLLTGLQNAGETFLEDTTPKTSMFILNLPIFVGVIGAIMMILFHSSIPKRTDERIQQGGFLQGV